MYQDERGVMEIGPISGIRPLPAVRRPKDGPQLPALFDIEGATEPRDDAVTRDNGTAAAGEDDETAGIEEVPESSESTDSDTPHSTVNLFA